MRDWASEDQVKMMESLCAQLPRSLWEKNKLRMMLWVKTYRKTCTESQKTCTESQSHKSDALFRRGGSSIALRLKECLSKAMTRNSVLSLSRFSFFPL